MWNKKTTSFRAHSHGMGCWLFSSIYPNAFKIVMVCLSQLARQSVMEVWPVWPLWPLWPDLLKTRTFAPRVTSHAPAVLSSGISALTTMKDLQRRIVLQKIRKFIVTRKTMGQQHFSPNDGCLFVFFCCPANLYNADRYSSTNTSREGLPGQETLSFVAGW